MQVSCEGLHSPWAQIGSCDFQTLARKPSAMTPAWPAECPESVSECYSVDACNGNHTTTRDLMCYASGQYQARSGT